MKRFTIFALIALLAFLPVVSAADVVTGYLHRYQLENNLLDTNGTVNIGASGTTAFNTTQVKQGNYSWWMQDNGYASDAGAHGLDGNVDHSMCLWLYPKTGGDDYGTVFGVGANSRTGGFSIIAKRNSGGNNNFYFAGQANDAEFTAAGGPGFNTWNHVCIVYTASSKTVNLYLNGTSRENQTLAANENVVNANVYLGGRSSTTQSGEEIVDDARIYGYALTAAEVLTIYNNPNGTGGGGGSAPPELTITLTNAITGAQLSGFCINATGTNTTQHKCNTTGTTIIFNTSGTYNITWFNITTGNSTPQWYNVTLRDYTFTINSAVSNATYQSRIATRAYRYLANTSISAYNITNGIWANQTTNGNMSVLAKNGTNNLMVQVAGNYTKNVTCTVTAPFVDASCNLTGIYDNLFTIGASYNGASVSNFTVSVANTTFGELPNVTTTTGNATFMLITGYDYYFFLNPVNHTVANRTLSANASTNLYNFTVYRAQTLWITLRDEITRALLFNITFDVALINSQQAANYSTTNGTFYAELIIPENYTIRYASENYPERDYYTIIGPQTLTNLTLYAITFNESSDILVTVNDNEGNRIEGAIVKLLRYYVYCNCYEVVEMSETSYAGVAYLNGQYYEGHYKWSVDYQGTNYFISTTPENLVPGDGENIVTRTITINLGQNYYEAYTDITDIGAVCAYNSTTGGLSFTWSDPNAAITGACLTVQNISGLSYTQVNLTCQNATTGGVAVVLPINASYIYRGYVLTDNTQVTVCSGTVDKDVGYDFSTIGMFISLSILVTLVLAFSYSAIAVMVISALGVLIISFLGFMPFDTAFISGLVVVVVGLGVYMMRS